MLTRYSRFIALMAALSNFIASVQVRGLKSQQSPVAAHWHPIPYQVTHQWPNAHRVSAAEITSNRSRQRSHLSRVISAPEQVNRDSSAAATASWKSSVSLTRQIVIHISSRLHQQSALLRKLSGRTRPTINRRLNPLLLPLRLLLALLRLILLPLRILLLPVILLLRALLRLLRLLLLLLNPLFYLYLALVALNLAANIARLVLLILRLIFLFRFKKRNRKESDEETRIITLDDESPVEYSTTKRPHPKGGKKRPQARAPKSADAWSDRADGKLEAHLFKLAQDDMIDKLRCLGLLSQIASAWSTEAETVLGLQHHQQPLRRLCNFHYELLQPHAFSPPMTHTQPESSVIGG